VTVVEGAFRDSPEWGRWGRQIRATHLDLSCHACAFAGPLLECFGTTVVPARTGRRIVQRSRITDGQRVRSVPYPVPSYPVRTHYAVRCPACGDQVVYRLQGWEELGADAVEGPAPPRPQPCCEHACGTGPHAGRQSGVNDE
jgi:predicted RNA-binding Zn-ribbon protein involved in translation (DUF1610 family)